MPFNYNATWAEQTSAPDTPASGKWKVYPKTDGIYAIDDAGTEYGPFSSENVALLTAATELTISAGSVTINHSHHTIDTQADAASDDLDTINGGVAGMLLYISAEHTDRTVVVKHGTGNIVTPSGSDITLDDVYAHVMLIYDDDTSSWVVLNEDSVSTGDVTGPGSSTDNAIARFDGTGGKTLQNSGVTIDDSNNLDMGGAEIRNFTEQIVTANTGASYEIDWSAATLFELTLTDSPTFTFANLAAGRSITLVLVQDGTGSRTVTWPASVDWPSATAPTLSAGASDVDVITMFVRNDGSTVLGFVAGQDMG